MSGITLTIDDTEVRRLLAGLRERGGNLRPALNVAATMMQQAVRNNFAQGGRPKWLPLKSRDGRPLRDTGRLMNSLTREATQTEARVGTNVVYAAVHHFGAAKGSFGTFLHQVQPHQRIITQAFGRRLRFPVATSVGSHIRRAKLPWGDIPARPFMMLEDTDVTDIRDMLARWIMEGK